MKADREIKVRCSACGHLTRIPTITNADRIRSMTDEELAEWLAEYAALLIANVLDDDYLVQTKSGWLDWLKWEV